MLSFTNSSYEHTSTSSTKTCCADYSNNPLFYESHTAPWNRKCHHCGMFLLSKKDLESHMISTHKSTENKGSFLCEETVNNGVNSYYTVIWGQHIGGHVFPV